MRNQRRTLSTHLRQTDMAQSNKQQCGDDGGAVCAKSSAHMDADTDVHGFPTGGGYTAVLDGVMGP